MKKFLQLAVIGLLATASAHATTFNVDISGLTYTNNMPLTFSHPFIPDGNPFVRAGDKVVFKAVPNVHPLRFDGNNFANGGAGCDNTCSFTFVNPPTDQEADMFNYYCQNHGAEGGAGMSGSFLVLPNPDVLFIGDFETPVIRTGSIPFN